MRQAIDWNVWAEYRRREGRHQAWMTETAAHQVAFSLVVSVVKVVGVALLRI